MTDPVETHTSALRRRGHDADNNVVLSVVAQELCENLIGTVPWILQTDAVAIEQYCRVEARARIINAYLDKAFERRGGVGKVPPSLLREATAADTAAMKAAKALGLTPEGRSAIIKDAALGKHFRSEGLAQLERAGAQIRRPPSDPVDVDIA